MLHVFRAAGSMVEWWWHGTGARKWRTASRCPTDMARWGAGSRPACGAGRTDARMGAGRIKADGCVCRQRTAVKGTWKTTVSDGILSYDTIVFFYFIPMWLVCCQNWLHWYMSSLLICYTNMTTLFDILQEFEAVYTSFEAHWVFIIRCV